MATAFTGSDDAPIVRVVWREGLAIEALDVAAFVRRYRSEWAPVVRLGRVTQALADLDFELAVEQLLDGRVVHWSEPPAGRLQLDELDAFVTFRPEALRRQWVAWAAAQATVPGTARVTRAPARAAPAASRWQPTATG